MTEPNQSVPRTKWWQIGLSVLFIPCMLIWLWVYLRNAGHFSDLFLHHGLYCPLIPLPYYFMPVLGYPWLMYMMTSIPYCLVLIALAVLILAGMAKIASADFLQNRFGKFLRWLSVILLVILAWWGIVWMLYPFLFLLILVGALYLYFRPSVKNLVTGLLFAGCFCCFFVFSIFYLNETLDGSPPLTVRGELTGVVNWDYYIVKPDSGGNKLGIWIRFQKDDDSNVRVIRRYHLVGLFCRYVYALGDSPFRRDSKGQLPRIEVYKVHRGFFGLKWQEYQQPNQGAYKLLLD